MFPAHPVLSDALGMFYPLTGNGIKFRANDRCLFIKIKKINIKIGGHFGFGDGLRIPVCIFFSHHVPARTRLCLHSCAKKKDSNQD